MKNLIYQQECYAIIGLCMEIHNTLGPGLLEIVYKDAMEYEFKKHRIPFQREKPYNIKYKDIMLPRRYYADFVAYDELILEVKADKSPIEAHLRQTLNYLTLAKSPLALIINFGENSLVFKRVFKTTKF